ncbi:MAG: YigZ family protein [Candidatus Cloacimonetes bacterium]|nr:YigZ family protein [Candidatus Cloacimonadota bacterium]
MKYYYSIKEDVIIETKIKRSKFIVHLHYAESVKDAKEYISKISTEHKTATHNCWAYIVGDRGETFHSSNAGEPPGTAGKPILNTLKNHNMTNIVAIVTRYFGGVKLGIRGLIDAYSECIENAVKKVFLKKLVKTSEFNVITTYDFGEILKHKLKNMGATISDIEYSDKVKLKIIIEDHKKAKLVLFLKEMANLGKIKLANKG